MLNWHHGHISARFRNAVALFTTLTTGLHIACGQQQAPPYPEVSLAKPARLECPPPSDESFFFPDSTFSTEEHNGRALRREYSEFLTAMSEPSLSCGDFRETYRLLYFRAFEPEPRVIRIAGSGRQFTLTAIELAGGATGVPLHLKNRMTKSISEEHWRALLTALAEMPFWAMRTYRVRLPHESILFFDGAWADTLLLEGRRGSAYHVIVRGPSEKGPPFRNAVALFYKLAGLDVPKID